MFHSRPASGAILLLALIPAAAQTGLRSFVSSELVRYLQLTADQASSINQLAAAWNSSLQDKTRQVNQINTDIQTETAKISPDPSALGGLYVGLEAVCRDATQDRANLLQKTRDVLNTGQRARLQALDDALSLMPRVIEAQKAGLLADSIDTAPVGLPAGQVTVSLTFSPASPTPLPGCLPPSTQAQPGAVPTLRPRVR
jgi:hypothetical protein